MWVLGVFSDTKVRNQPTGAQGPDLVDPPPVFINKVLLEHSHTHSFSCCLFTITTELNSWARDHVAYKAKNICHLVLYRNSCWPLIWAVDWISFSSANGRELSGIFSSRFFKQMNAKKYIQTTFHNARFQGSALIWKHHERVDMGIILFGSESPRKLKTCFSLWWDVNPSLGGTQLQGTRRPLLSSDVEALSYQSLPLAWPQAVTTLRNPAAVSGSSEPSFPSTLLILADVVCSLPWRPSFYTYFLGHIYLYSMYNVKSCNDKVCGCPKR